MPLTQEKIEQFLISRGRFLSEDAVIKGADYERSYRDYLSTTFQEETQKILSNPMDLTLISHMLATNQKPDLFHLQKQQYDLMIKDYNNIYPGEEFPLKKFSQKVYEMRLEDKAVIPEEFQRELLTMERHKMVLKRHIQDREGVSVIEWRFRHDKVMEFFIVQTFLGPHNERPVQHLGDPKFRGLYFLLAILMPLEEAGILREEIINYAADNKDHTVSDTFIRLLRARRESD